MTDASMPTGDSPIDDAFAHVTGANDQRSKDVVDARDQRATVEVEEVAKIPRIRYELERPWNKVRLIGELARAEKNQQTLADEYGVTRSAIAMFKQRNLTIIQERRNDLAAEFDGLWIASKVQRLATLQAAAEGLAAKPDARSAEVLAKLLKDAAEELGDLPTRAGVQIQTNNVEYKVIGIGLDALQ